jgi:hypothetical protein
MAKMWTAAVAVLLLLTVAEAFAPPTPPSIIRSSSSCLSTTTTTNEMIDLSSRPGEQLIYDFFQQLHTCGYPFRTIVIGHGAILESTQILGSKIKVTESPKTGNLILTMASEDQSFEFHVKLELVYKISFVERQMTEKVLRIIRMTNEKEESMCSLILAEYSEDAEAFFRGLVTRYGTEFLPYSLG